MSADIIRLSDHRIDDGRNDEIDLATAVDVAIRDLREIRQCWGTEVALRRVEECELTLHRAFSGFVGSTR